MGRTQRLTDGTRWRTFMRLLRLDDLMTSYTNASPRSWCFAVDPGTASGLIASSQNEWRTVNGEQPTHSMVDSYALISSSCFVAIPTGRSIGMPVQARSVVNRSP